MSGPFKMKGWSPFTQKKETLHIKPGSTADKKSKGWKGLIVSEGQGSKRKGKYTVDPDAPGFKYGPGYEPTEKKTIPVIGKNHERKNK